MDVQNFVMVYNEIEEHGGVKRHEHEAEHGYFIIEGKMLLRIGKEEKEVEAGTAIYIPSGVPHSFRAIGEGKLNEEESSVSCYECKYLYVINNLL
jgi:mannose-6-phosphate isomerase-like protein (cupin superfamily)